MSFDQKKYINEYNLANYDKVTFRIPKGKREILKRLAKEQGISISQLIVTSIEYTHHVDLSR